MFENILVSSVSSNNLLVYLSLNFGIAFNYNFMNIIYNWIDKKLKHNKKYTRWDYLNFSLLFF